MGQLDGFLIMTNGKAISFYEFESTILQPTFVNTSSEEIINGILLLAIAYCTSAEAHKRISRSASKENLPIIYRNNNAYVAFNPVVLEGVLIINVHEWGTATKRKK